jgi:hypothetical protein
MVKESKSRTHHFPLSGWEIRKDQEREEPTRLHRKHALPLCKVPWMVLSSVALFAIRKLGSNTEPNEKRRKPGQAEKVKEERRKGKKKWRLIEGGTEKRGDTHKVGREGRGKEGANEGAYYYECFDLTQLGGALVVRYLQRSTPIRSCLGFLPWTAACQRFISSFFFCIPVSPLVAISSLINHQPFIGIF